MNNLSVEHIESFPSPTSALDTIAITGSNPLGNNGSNPSNQIGLKQLAVFPTALTDSECIALTTL